MWGTPLMPNWETVYLQPSTGTEQGQLGLGNHGGVNLEFLRVGVSQN